MYRELQTDLDEAFTADPNDVPDPQCNPKNTHRLPRLVKTTEGNIPEIHFFPKTRFCIFFFKSKPPSKVRNKENCFYKNSETLDGGWQIVHESH